MQKMQRPLFIRNVQSHDISPADKDATVITPSSNHFMDGSKVPISFGPIYDISFGLRGLREIQFSLRGHQDTVLSFTSAFCNAIQPLLGATLRHP